MNRFPKLSRFVALFLSTLVFIALAIIGFQQQKINPPGNITLAYTIKFNSSLARLAFARDRFKVEGLAATLKLHDFGKSDFQADISRVLYDHV
jgi:hypothetical protein